MPLTRVSLLGRLRGNTADGWNEFVNQYLRVVDDYAKPYSRSFHDQRDIVQNVWLVLCRIMPRFEYQPSKGGFRRLLKRIVRNTAVDWFRRRREVPIGFNQPGDVMIPSEPESSQEDQSATLKSAMMMVQCKVSPLAWKCFERHVLGQQMARDVAQQCDISVNSVYVNASRVLERIRQHCQFVEQARSHD